MSGRITWFAVLQHAVIGAGACLAAGAAFGAIGVWVAAPAALLAFTAREIRTAATRHSVGLADGAAIVWRGEPGFSPWNLRLQAIAPIIGALPIVIFARSMFG